MLKPLTHSLMLALAGCFLCLSSASAQSQTASQPVTFRVSSNSQKLEMTVNTSRILTLEHNVPRMLVNNTEVVRATPLSPNQVQLSALRAGATQVNFWDEHDKAYTVDITVLADVGELERVLAKEFPEASLKLRPTNTSVIISGYVPKAEMVGSIVRIAEDYYPRIVNRLEVGGVQQVALKVKVMEASRTKLRRLGINWSATNGQDFIRQTVGGIVAASSPTEAPLISFGIVNNSSAFLGYINALQKDDLIKITAEPTLVTRSGRAASFNSGGEFPIMVPQSLGTVTVQFREFGTRVDFVPIVLGNGSIHLEVRPQVSELDPTRSVTVGGTTVPGLRNRWVDTAIEMRPGQTMVLGGLIQDRTEAQRQAIPLLGDLPWAGAAFRAIREENNQIELVIMVTPELVDALDPEDVPAIGPGQSTESPCDNDLYGRGYLEVPKGYGISCDGNNCRSGKCNNRDCQENHMQYSQQEVVMSRSATPARGQVVRTTQPQQPQQTRQAMSVVRQSPPPQTTTTNRRTSQQIPQRQTSPSNTNSQNQPELIGPIGYDVLR